MMSLTRIGIGQKGIEMADIRAVLIGAGVKNLKEFGYPDVSVDNILTDMIYSKFFKGMLEDTIADYPGTEVTPVAEALLGELKE